MLRLILFAILMIAPKQAFAAAAQDWYFGVKQFSAGGILYNVDTIGQDSYHIYRNTNILYGMPPAYSWGSGYMIPMVRGILKFNPEKNLRIMDDLVNKVFTKHEREVYSKNYKSVVIVDLYFSPDSKKPKEVSFLMNRTFDMVEPEKLAQLEKLVLSQEFVFGWNHGITSYAVMEFSVFFPEDIGINGVYMQELDTNGYENL